MDKQRKPNINYELPSTLNQDINRFENELNDFRTGDLHATAFTAKRVKMGIYQERNYKTHMCRIRCAGNIITPIQLVKIAELAEKYGHPWVHVTTRSEIQIHHTNLDDVVAIIRELKEVGLTMKGGGGHTIRNIWTNHDSGIHPAELFDVQPYALALTGRLIAEADSFELPRKFKTTFSSLAEDAAFSPIQDLSFVARINAKGQKGFRVYVGGGLGAKPYVGIVLHDFIAEEKVYHVAKAIKKVFHDFGNRRNKHHSRIRFLIHEDLGVEKFGKLYRQELDKIYQDDSLKLQVLPIDNAANLQRDIELEPLTENIEGFEAWYERNVSPQKQQGLYRVKLPLNLGDLDSRDCFKLEETLRPFGDNVLRCGSDQNFHLRNIPVKFLKNVYKGLRDLQTLSDKPCLYGAIVPCTGAQTCQLGLNRPRPATTAIFKQFDETDLDYDILKNIRIHISGCPNACSNHWIGDLGFFGKVRRVEGRLIPTYNVLGGGSIKPSATRFGQPAGWVHARDLPRFLTEVLRAYQNYKKQMNPELNFYQYWTNGGKDFVANLCRNDYSRVPTYQEDKNYYFDYDTQALFSVKDIGKAECAAGIYDMINVDDKAIKTNVKIIESCSGSRQDGALQEILKNTVFSACRMLLVTRGEEPKTNRKIYELFLIYFVDAGLVEENHRMIVDLVRDEKFDHLRDHKDKVLRLANDVTALYQTMDDTMRFPGETENLAINMEAKTYDSQPHPSSVISETRAKMKPGRVKDLRGVKCPINFAKTKIQLAAMKSGELLEIYLDDGPPIENVPASAKLEGHKILNQEKTGSHWTVLIEKK